MSPRIDNQSVVDPGAQLADDVEVGPFCWIGPGVKLGPGCRLISHCRLEGPSTYGANNLFYPFSAIGLDTPDKKYRGEVAMLEVGDNNIFREHVTVHRGTEVGGGTTRIGSGNLFMPSSHVAHDCSVGDSNIMANAAGIGGHCALDDYVTLGAHVVMHQHCVVGSYAFVGMNSSVTMDVLPFISVRGDPARYIGINRLGLTRHGKSPEEISEIKRAARLLVKGRVRRERALKMIDEMAKGEYPDIAKLADFARNSQRGLSRA